MNRRRSRSYTWALALAMLMGVSQMSCLEEIQLEAPEGIADALVIQGSILKGNPSIIRVTINKVFDFTGSTVPPVNVALAEVIDEQGRKLKLEELALGLYGFDVEEGNPDFEIEFGSSYQLHVRARDNREYYTNYEPLLPVPEATSIGLETITVDIINNQGENDTEDKFRFTINTPLASPDANGNSRLKWDVERVYKFSDTPISPLVQMKTCYLTDNVVGSELQTLDGTKATGDLNDYPLYTTSIDWYFAEGYYLNVYQQGLSEGALKYWQEASALANRSGNMFEPPAGKISTNLMNPNDPEDEVYGYFYAYAQDTTRLYVSPEMAGNPGVRCPPPQGLIAEGGGCAAPICCDCFNHPNSTTSQPEWWVE